MKIKSLLPLTTLLGLMWTAGVSATEVTVTLNTISKSMTVVPAAGGETVNIGEPSADSNPVYTFNCDPGDYVMNLFDAKGTPTGSITVSVSGETDNVRLYNISLYATNKTDGIEWQLGKDYDVPFDRINVSSQKGENHPVTPVVYANSTRKVITFPVKIGDSFTATLFPSGDYAEDYAEVTITRTVTFDVSASCTFEPYVTFSLTAPKDAEVKVAQKIGSRHYVPFTYYDPATAVESGNDMVYTYRLPKSSNYNYRVSRPGSITNAGIFDPSKGEITITDAQLNAYPSDYYNHDVAANSGYNYADIYLNINPQGHLHMQPDSKFHIVNLRTWQLTNTVTANYFIEPDYHYTVLGTDFKPDNSVIDITTEGLITAKKQGTAIVQVRYDAMSVDVAGGNLWSSIWAENVGTFVVTVGDKAEGIRSNMKLPYTHENRTGEIDAEHDVFYYMKGEDGFDYTFTPEGVASVSVATPLVDLEKNTLSYPSGFSTEKVSKNADGSYTVRLAFGRNIVCLTDAAGNSVYQVMSAKPASYSVSKAKDVRNDSYNLPGDVLEVNFSGLYHNAGKLAAIYNQGCSPLYSSIPEGYDSNSVKGSGGQYNFPVQQKVTVTLKNDQQPIDFDLSGGCLTFGGFGDKLGGHRDIDYFTGRNPNFTAASQYQLSGVIPDVSFRTDAFADGMELSMSLEFGKSATPVSLAACKLFLGEDMTVTSSDKSIATVDKNGKVTAVADGNAVITYANADGTKRFTCSVEVWSIKVEGIAFKDEVVEAVASTKGTRIISTALIWTPAKPSNQNVTYELSNPDVVSLKNNRLYTIAGKAGETDVTVTTADGGYKATCHVIVRMALEKLAFEESAEELTEGESLSLKPVYTPENTDFKELIWVSTNPEIASVDENGLVTALKEGTASIKATSTKYSYISATRNVTVKAKDQSGIETVGIAGVKAYPNPFTDYIMVQTPVATSASVYSLQGSLLISASLEAGQNRIVTSALPSGLYLVRIGSETVKMIRK